MDAWTGDGTIRALEYGSVDEASVAIERLFKVTEATIERTAQLHRALESRVVIEQAKGVLAERFALAVDEAFVALPRAARSHRMELHELARQVVTNRETPPEILASLQDPA